MFFSSKFQMVVLATIVVSFLACKEDNDIPDPIPSEENFYTQGGNNRTAAEWEPALGTMITWPLAIPYQLAVELSNDNHLYTLVHSDSARVEAESWFSSWGISLGNVTFIVTPQSEASQWTRDWGPSAVFTSSKQYMLADGKYPYGSPTSLRPCNSTLVLEPGDNGQPFLTPIEDNTTINVANQLGYGLMDLPFVNTGGNVYTDGLESAFSTCIMYNENEYHGVSRSSLLQMNESMLGFRNYNITSNFEENGIQHIDCLMKVINEETLLVAEPPSGHALHSVYENIVTNELSKLKTAYGRPYKILRIKTDLYDGYELAAYTNSLILNKTVYVPLFDIAQDMEALETWRNAMPGYTVKGFKFRIADEPPVNTEYLTALYGSYGWNGGDALHCRTRAIWDPEMLFISVKSVPDQVSSDERNIVYTTIIDYDGSGLNKSECQLFWRVEGQSDWNGEVLSPAEGEGHFFTEIPHNDPGTTVEYYVSAVSNSGKTETKPRTAPLGSYKFQIQ